MKEVAIKDICKKDSSALKQKELLPEGKYPVFGASGIAGYLDRYHQKKEYIGIVKDGSGIGRVAFYPAESSLIGTMQYVLPKENYDIRYIGYCLQSLDLSKYKQGAAIPHIYFRDYGEQLVKVTDNWEEQHSIVSRLDSAFSYIDALKANAEKQLNEARKLFQAELTECMKPKEGWEEKTLKEVGITQTGTTPPKSDTSNYGEYISFIRPAELNFDGMGGINYESEIKLSEKGVERSRLIKANSILMCCIGSVGKMGFSTKEVTCNQQINTITPKSNYSPKFVYYAMLDKKFLDDIIKEAKSAQATLPIISKGKWERHKIHVPYLVEQHSIVSHLDSLSSTIRKLEELQQKTFAECDALKQAMLREVFE